MSKWNIFWKTILACLAIAGGLSTTQAMGSYRFTYGSPYGHLMVQQHLMMQQHQKQQRTILRRQLKAQFFHTYPWATKDQWKMYWKNYKRQHGIFP